MVDDFKTSFEKRCEKLFFEENGIKDQVTKVKTLMGRKYGDSLVHHFLAPVLLLL